VRVSAGKERLSEELLTLEGCALLPLPSSPPCSLRGSSLTLASLVLQRYNFNKSSSKIGARSHEERSDPDLILEGITTAYLNTDKMLQQATSTNATPGSGFRLKQFDQMGSTAVSCYINEVDMCVAWLGDSRAVLCRSGLAVAMTTDHKPNDATEAARIAKAGGEVMRGRVNGQLAVSRSFGDFYYKTPPESPPEEQMVSASPDTMSMPRDLINDEFLILACDGVWDAITNQDACYIIGELIARKVPVETICQKFMDYCLIANSRDNMTVIIALFPASKRLQVRRSIDRSSEAAKEKGGRCELCPTRTAGEERQAQNDLPKTTAKTTGPKRLAQNLPNSRLPSPSLSPL